MSAEGLQTLAAVVAAIAALGYLVATIWMVGVMTATMKQQKRVAELMELDIRARTAPNLLFHPLGGQVSQQRGEIRNEGSGTAIHVRGPVRFHPSGRSAPFTVGYWMEQGKTATFNVGLQKNEQGFEVEIECDDTIGFNHYTFRADASTNYPPTVIPRGSPL